MSDQEPKLTVVPPSVTGVEASKTGQGEGIISELPPNIAPKQIGKLSAVPELVTEVPSLAATTGQPEAAEQPKVITSTPWSEAADVAGPADLRKPVPVPFGSVADPTKVPGWSGIAPEDSKNPVLAPEVGSEIGKIALGGEGLSEPPSAEQLQTHDTTLESS